MKEEIKVEDRDLVGRPAKRRRVKNLPKTEKADEDTEADDSKKLENVRPLDILIITT